MKPALVVAAGVAATAMLVGEPAPAQRAKPVPQAFAAVQAPEAAVEACHSTSVLTAIDCARRKCERKAGRGACFSVTACSPSGWSGIMGVQLGATHFSSVICGAPTREAVFSALRVFCGGHTGLRQCSTSQIWGPDGKLHNVEHTWTPADFKK